METKVACSARVYPAGEFRGRSCSKWAVAVREVQERRPGRAMRVYDEETFTFGEAHYTEGEVVTVSRAFCGTHDPEAVAAREAKKRTEWQRERDASDRLSASMDEKLARLAAHGVAASKVWEPGRGLTSQVQMYASDVDALLAKLDDLSARVREYESK